MSDPEHVKSSTAKDFALADATMDKKILALKKAIKDFFPPAKSYQYDLHPKKNFVGMISDAYEDASKLITNEIHGIATEGLEKQIPKMAKLGYGQSLLEVIDAKNSPQIRSAQTEKSKYTFGDVLDSAMRQEAVNLSTPANLKPPHVKMIHYPSFSESLAGSFKFAVDKIENFFASEFGNISPGKTDTLKKPESKPVKVK